MPPVVPHPELDALVTKLAAKRQSDGKLAGIDPILIITILTWVIPMLIKCFRPDSAEQLQKYVTKRYNPHTNRYDKRLLKGVVRQIRTEARTTRDANGYPVRLTWDEGVEMAELVLDRAMNGDLAELDGVIREND